MKKRRYHPPSIHRPNAADFLFTFNNVRAEGIMSLLDVTEHMRTYTPEEEKAAEAALKIATSIGDTVEKIRNSVAVPPRTPET